MVEGVWVKMLTTMSHIWNYFIENIISGMQLFYISPSFFLFQIFQKKVSKLTNNIDKITYFAIHVCAQNTSLILWTSTDLTLKIICSQNTAKNLPHFANFSGNMFLLGVRKNICTAPFLYTQELYSWSNLKANACVFRCT